MVAAKNDQLAWGRLVASIGAAPQFLTKSTFEATKCAPNLVLAGMSGFSAPGDVGQGGVYRRVVGQPVLAAGWFRSRDRFLPDGTSSDELGGYWQCEPVQSKLCIGAMGGIANDTGAEAVAFNRLVFTSAGQLMTARGTGGVVVVPEGNFTIGGIEGVASAAIHLTSGVSIQGVNRRVAQMSAAVGSNVHLIQMSGTEDITISGLTLNHDGPNQTRGVHAIRVGDFGAAHITIKEMNIYDARHYAIGFQGSVGGDGINSFINMERHLY